MNNTIDVVIYSYKGKKLKENFTIPIKATFLGAHAFPPEYKENHRGYIDLIINDMLPAIAKENLADYMDVFCEKGYFTDNETERLLLAGKKYGLVLCRWWKFL